MRESDAGKALEPARAVRFAVAWTAVAGGAALATLWVDPPAWNAPLGLLAVLGFLTCASPLRLGSRMELSVAQPVSFAALLLWGTPAALVVAASCLLGSSLLRPRRLAPVKVIFNVAVALGTMLGAGGVLRLLADGSTGGGLQVAGSIGYLVATAVAFPLSTIPVAIAAGLDVGTPALGLWRNHFLPTAPGYLAGSALALLLEFLVEQAGVLSLILFLPLTVFLFLGAADWLPHASEARAVTRPAGRATLPPDSAR